MNPVMESLLEEAARNPYPAEHTSPYWRAEGENLTIRREGDGISFRGFGLDASLRPGIAWKAFHALERASYRRTTAQLRSYKKTWAALQTLAREMSLPISYDIWKTAVITAVLADHWETWRLSPRTFVIIGDGCGILGALIRRVRPGARLFCIDLPKALVFQSSLHNRADATTRLSRVSGPERSAAEVTFVLPQEIESIAEPIDCAINIASMQEMNASSIRVYFQFLRRRSRSDSHFYCVNRKEKKLPGGETARMEDYPWDSKDKIFLDGPCPYYTHTFSRCMRPAGPHLMGIRIPFISYFDGPMEHRLAHLEPLS